jgi:hypothetical protein
VTNKFVTTWIFSEEKKAALFQIGISILRRRTMLKIRFAINALAVLVFTLALASLAEASQQTFVSTSGNDASATCDHANPCRTFNMAVLRTENGGEVIALDSGEYGPIVANRLVSVIAAPGVHAQITATSGDAINFSGMVGSIVLRGLTIVGHGTGANGITSTCGGALYVENCVIDGFAGGGINFQQIAKLFVKDTIVRNNGQSSFAGIYITLGATVSIDHCSVENNGYGIVIDGGRITIRDSVVSGNVHNGFWARGLDWIGASNIENCMVTYNETGISTGNGSGTPLVYVSNTTITGNTYGVSIAKGSIYSFGNNRLAGNSSDGSFSLWGPGLK